MPDAKKYVTKELHRAEIETVLLAVDNTKDLIEGANKRIDDMQNSVSRQFTILAIIIAIIQILFAVLIIFMK